MKLFFCNTFRFDLGGMQISRLGLATATYLVQYWTNAQQFSLARRVKTWPDVHSRKVNFYSRNPAVLRQTLQSQALHSLSGIYHSFKNSWSLHFFLLGGKAVYQTEVWLLPSKSWWHELRLDKSDVQIFLLSKFRGFHGTVWNHEILSKL